MKNLEDKLSNPVWHSLNETHNKFLVSYDGVQFYQPDVCTFGSFYDNKKTAQALNEYAKIAERFFLVSENGIPEIDTNCVVLEKKIDGCQMVLKNFTAVAIKENIILLTKTHMDEVYDLIWLVMPGFYQRRTFEMGKYYGIFKNEKLVSITGQRMQTEDFIELSAVVTHPKHTRKGYAQQLITHTTIEILKDNKLPILHTNKGNAAIPLYEKLGYQITRDMNWWLFRRK
jgi:GNAT superfamily N-acetyltransferase